MNNQLRIFGSILVCLLLLFGVQQSLSAAPATAASDDFIITVKTDNPGSSASTAFTIPTTGSGYNYNVDCNNDATDEATGVTGDYTCDYGPGGLNTGAGTYTIRIKDNSGSGTGFPRIYFNQAGDKVKLLSVEQWGTGQWTSMEKAFAGCYNLVVNATDEPDLSGVTSMVSMFYGASSFNQSIGGWNVSTVTNMQYLFGAATTFNQDLAEWDTSNVEKMDYIFTAAYAFNQDIGGWETGNVWNMAGMFSWATAFNQDISGWDTSSVTVMNDMFYNAQNFNQDISGWTMDGVMVVSGMFRNANAFNQDLSAWNTGSFVTTDRMFMDADVFDQDLSAWNVSSLTTAEEMFANVKLSTANYDALLAGWEAQTLQSGVTFDGGLSNYCNAEVERGNLVNNDGWTITDGGKDCAPPMTTLVSPVDGATVVKENITFIWDKVEGADRYTLEVKQVSDNVTVHNARYSAAVRCGATTCSVTLAGPFEYRDYKWHVAGWGGSDRGPFTPWNVFDTTMAAVQLRSPGVDAIVYGGRPTFKWYQHPEALSYIIEFYDHTGGTPVLIDTWQKNPPCTPYCYYRIPDDLGSDYGDYQWRVRAKNSGLEGEWSEMRTFTYTQLERTSQISPADGITWTDTTPTFEWQQITGATMYLFQMRLLNDDFVGNYLVEDDIYCSGSTCTWTIPPGELSDLTTYKWHVRAKNGRNFGRWTAYREITIEVE